MIPWPGVHMERLSLLLNIASMTGYGCSHRLQLLKYIKEYQPTWSAFRKTEQSVRTSLQLPF